MNLEGEKWRVKKMYKLMTKGILIFMVLPELSHLDLKLNDLLPCDQKFVLGHHGGKWHERVSYPPKKILNGFLLPLCQFLLSLCQQNTRANKHRIAFN